MQSINYFYITNNKRVRFYAFRLLLYQFIFVTKEEMGDTFSYYISREIFAQFLLLATQSRKRTKNSIESRSKDFTPCFIQLWIFFFFFFERRKWQSCRTSRFVRSPNRQKSHILITGAKQLCKPVGGRLSLRSGCQGLTLRRDFLCLQYERLATCWQIRAD